MKTHISCWRLNASIKTWNPLATRRTSGLVLGLLLGWLLAGPGRAAQITWTNTGSGAWSAAANWNPNTLPGASDTAVIANAGVKVTLDISPTVGGIVLGSTSGGGVTFSLNNQTLTLNGPFTVNPSGSFTVDSGTLVGGPNAVLSGTIGWTAGSLAGVLTLASGGELNLPGSSDHNMPNCTFTNNGTVVWTSGYVRGGGNGTVIVNHGLWDSQGDLTFNNAYSGSGSVVFNNPGTFRKSASTGGSTFIYGAFNNTGQLDVQAGSVSLGGGGYFTGGTATNLAGYIVLSGGAFNLNGTAITTNMQLNGGTLTGNNVLAGGLNWLTGDWNSATAVTVPAGSVLWLTSANDHNLPNVTLTNNGTVTWTGGHIRGGGTVVYNNGLWDSQGDLTFNNAYSGSGAVVFNNASLFRKTASTGGSTFIYATFNNTGLLLSETNAISLQAGGSLTGGVLSGAIGLDGGLFNLNGALTSIQVQLAGGELTGTTVINGGLNWISGDCNTAPSVTITTNSVLYITSGNNHDMANVTLVNNGWVGWTGGLIRGGGTTICNHGWWDAAGNLTFNNAYSGPVVFNNDGMFDEAGGTTVFANGVLFTNTGQLEVQDGNVSLQGSYALAPGTMLRFGLGGASGNGSLTLSGAAAFTGSLSAYLIGYYWPAAGSAFPLINANALGLNLTNLTLPAPGYIAWQTNFGAMSFSLSVKAQTATNTAVTQLAMTPVSSNRLLLQWPGDHTGWKVLVQTNPLAVGLATGWAELTGSALTNQFIVPLDPTLGSVFYRLAD